MFNTLSSKITVKTQGAGAHLDFAGQRVELAGNEAEVTKFHFDENGQTNAVSFWVRKYQQEVTLSAAEMMITR